jgi:hypothetical protein
MCHVAHPYSAPAVGAPIIARGPGWAHLMQIALVLAVNSRFSPVWGRGVAGRAVWSKLSG